MKRIILVLVLNIFALSLFGMKFYISDGTIESYYFGYRSINIQEIGQQHYLFTPVNDNFSDVPFETNITTITIDQSRCIVVAKSDNEIEVISANPINASSASWFHIGISTGHAIMCRDQLMEEVDGVIDSSNVFVGPISFNSNLIGIAEAFDIDIISVSQSGMCDNYNEVHAPPFTALGKLIVYAHYGNDHEELNNSTYIGDIVTVSYGANTGTNQGSFGDGLELFYNPGGSQSASTPHVAGMFAKLKLFTGKTWDEIRAVVDETCSYDEWQEDGGYGAINYDLALSVLLDDPEIVINGFLPSAGGNITINELESIAFSIDAYDPDGNTLNYSWELDGNVTSTTDSYDFTTDYTSAGTYEVSLEVTDNVNPINYNWDITVNNVDQTFVVNEIQPSAGGSITINELESIAFSIDAYDPDGNTLSYSWELDGDVTSTTDSYDFSTDYTSAGNYDVSLEVTDNVNPINYNWNITVNNVDQTFVVNEIQPSAGGSITINELESIAFSIDAYDPDGNTLSYNWELDGNVTSTTDSYDFTTDYTSAGTYDVSLEVTDSVNPINYNWDITVNNVDQTFVVNEIQPSAGGSITINELESIAFSIDAYDPDGNTLSYNWELDGNVTSTNDSYDFSTDYTSAGTYDVSLEVTDNVNPINYNWNITVNNVDQAFVVNEIQPSAGGSITINELESIAFSIDAYDPDGNTLSYSWELDGDVTSTTDSYDFTTDYTSAGTYEVTLEVTDNVNPINYNWDITVNNVDQTFVINEILPSSGGSITINELESIAFSIDAYDPDGNTLSYNWELDGNVTSTTDSYDFTTDYTSAGTYEVTLEVTDNVNPINYNWDITVNNVDQTFVINELLPSSGGSITINELESIAFSIDAYDPDGNTLSYNWELDGNVTSTTDSYDFTTDYTSAGNHLVTLTITDDTNQMYYSWFITVNNIDQNIVVNEVQPSSGGNITINENESVAFSIDAYDPDGNTLNYSWKLFGTEISTSASYIFTTDYSSAGIYAVVLTVSDNVSDDSFLLVWFVTVVDVNTEINVETLEPAPGEFCVDQSDDLCFKISTNNPNNEVTYCWIFDGEIVSISDDFLLCGEVYPLGEHSLQLIVTLDVSERDALFFDWNIDVVNSNLPPVANAGEDQDVESNASVQLDGSNSYDPEGEDLSFHWIVPDEIVLSDSTITNPTFIAPDVMGEVIYRIQLYVDDGENKSIPSKLFITVNGSPSSNDPVISPQLTTLRCNYPNPFNPTTSIKFDVQDNETAMLTIFNQKGQVVESNGFAPGTHNFDWNAHNVSSGVYFYQLKSKSYTKTKKMMLLK